MVYATECKIKLPPFPDYVFLDDYRLKPIEEVDRFIQANGHLPDLPSAQEVEENGIGVGELQVKLLEKIEELTLYTIQQQEEIDELKRKLEGGKQ